MLPALIDFPCRRNADYGEEFPIMDGSFPVDLSGLVFDMHVRRYPHGPLLFALETVVTDEEGIRIVDAFNGTLQIIINELTLRTAYDALVTNQYSGETVKASHDIRVTYSDGIKQVWAQGILSIEPGVTNNG